MSVYRNVLLPNVAGAVVATTIAVVVDVALLPNVAGAVVATTCVATAVAAVKAKYAVTALVAIQPTVAAGTNVVRAVKNVAVANVQFLQITVGVLI